MSDQDIHQSLYEAAIHHQAGRLKEAEKIYLQVLTIAPSNPEANHNLGVLAMQTGKNTEIALPRFQKAWQADPSHQQHWASYIRALMAAGEQATAQEVYADGQRRGLGGPDPSTMQSSNLQRKQDRRPQRKTEVQPDISREVREINGLWKKRKFSAAEHKARTLTEKYPRRVEGWKFLGLALRELGREDDAYTALGAAVQLSLQSSEVDAELWYALGELTYLKNMYRETEVAMQRVLSVEPQNVNANLLLARALLKLYLPADAESVCLATLKDNPDSAELHRTLAEALQSQGREDEAVQSFQRALTLNPRDVEAYQALGKILFEKHRYDEILSLCRLTISKAPDFFFAHSDYGTVLQLMGRIEEAMAAYRQALTLRPDDLATRSAWLFCCNYVAAMPAQAMLKEAAKYGKSATAQAEAYSGWKCDDSPEKLRVGFVSGDLREHPVGYFLENVLAHSDPERIEWFAYSTVAMTDKLSERLQHRVERWTVLSGMGAKDCAQLIYDDAVHLLLDLSGHTAHNMLPTFAWRPAPVQASWLGYFATTGLAEMDYFIADSVGVPTTEQAYFTETVWNLPDTRLCFTPPEDAPEVSSTPALSNNFVTFGCFQRLPKITDETLRSWSRILESCKDSRLRIQSEGLDQEPQKDDFLERAALLGIPKTRLELAGKEPRADYLARHAEIDIILDCFPFSGGATTCEALWMGVPTVTLAGATLVSRQGASLLSAAGLDDWVATTAEGFVELAIEKASDLHSLEELRATLREQVLSSPLYDGERFANHLADALHGMWDAR